jgi:hypothetical protein
VVKMLLPYIMRYLGLFDSVPHLWWPDFLTMIGFVEFSIDEDVYHADAQGRWNGYINGDHIKTSEAGSCLPEIRTENCTCRKQE